MLKKKQIAFLQEEIIQGSIEKQLVVSKIQQKIQTIKKLCEDYVCADISNAFWDGRQHMLELPCQKDFDEGSISTKVHPIQMHKEFLQFCKKEIQSL